MPILNQQQTREQVAWEEVGHTTVRAGAAWVLTSAFVLACIAIPVWQVAAEWRAARRDPAPFRPQVASLWCELPDLTAPGRAGGARGVAALVEANRLLLRHLSAFEDRLDDESRLGLWIRPLAQSLLGGWPGVGNEQVYIGRNGWLFYRPDLDYLTGPGFLDPRWQKRRMSAVAEWETLPQPDPRPAILDFKRQLDERGILLLLLPVPVKPGVHPEQFASRVDGRGAALHNRSYGAFIQAMEQHGVMVLDPSPLLVQRKAETGAAQYLATDTHWRPEAMEAVARVLAGRIHTVLSEPEDAAGAPRTLTRRAVEWSATGDIVRMLDLPAASARHAAEPVRLQQVLDTDGHYWRSSEEAEVLVLGDSFSNIYSLDALGWGESAGFVEQLAFHLGRPVDRLARNDGGAYATRDMLRRELARGRDRLEGKRVVVWQFAARELAAGDWRVMVLERHDPPETPFIVPPSGTTMVVSGMVRKSSPAPRPGAVPYRDHIVSVHLVDIQDAGQAMLYMHSMTNNLWTRAARLRDGEVITVRLRPWADVADRYDGINRSEFDDMELQLQDPCWGEWLE